MTLAVAPTRQVTVTQIICGVDISSSSLDVRVGRDGASAVFPNTAAGISALADFCHTHQVDLVAMEATGGYEQQPFALLSEQGLDVAILNPRAVRRFAEGMGMLEKTDALDAGMIAWFAVPFAHFGRCVCLVDVRNRIHPGDQSLRYSATG